MSEERREALKPYLDKRVSVTGMYDTSREFASGKRYYPAILLQDCSVITPDGDTLDIGHVWIQQANITEELLRYGDRIKLTARVLTYVKRMPDGGAVRQFGLGYPAEVEILDRVPRPEPEPVDKVTYQEMAEQACAALPAATTDEIGAWIFSQHQVTVPQKMLLSLLDEIRPEKLIIKEDMTKQAHIAWAPPDSPERYKPYLDMAYAFLGDGATAATVVDWVSRTQEVPISAETVEAYLARRRSVSALLADLKRLAERAGGWGPLADLVQVMAP